MPVMATATFKNQGEATMFLKCDDCGAVFEASAKIGDQMAKLLRQFEGS